MRGQKNGMAWGFCRFLHGRTGIAISDDKEGGARFLVLGSSMMQGRKCSLLSILAVSSDSW